MVFGPNVDVVWAPLQTPPTGQSSPQRADTAAAGDKKSNKTKNSNANRGPRPSNTAPSAYNASVISFNEKERSQSPSGSLDEFSAVSSQRFTASASENSASAGELVSKLHPPFNALKSPSLGSTSASDGEEEVRKYKEGRAREERDAVRQKLRTLRLAQSGAASPSMVTSSLGPWNSNSTDTGPPEASTAKPAGSIATNKRKRKKKIKKKASSKQSSEKAAPKLQAVEEDGETVIKESAPKLASPSNNSQYSHEKDDSFISMEPQHSEQSMQVPLTEEPNSQNKV